MENLVVMKNQQAVTTSLQVAEVFQKSHRHVLEAIDSLKEGVAENWADLFYEDTYVHPQNKQTYRQIIMTRDGFTLLAMGFTGSKAMQFKLQYIQAFNEMENKLAYPRIPTTLPEALRLAADLEEEKAQLKIENEEMKPKALFADSVAASHTTILIGDLAKVLRGNGVNIGQNRLFEVLRKEGFLISRKGTSYNMPTQKAMDLGLFRVKETSITHSDGHVTVNKTPKVTGKGQQYFVNRFLARSDN